MATHSSILAWKCPTDREAWQATVHRVSKNQTRLSDSTTGGFSFALGLDCKLPQGRASNSSACHRADTQEELNKSLLSQ